MYVNNICELEYRTLQVSLTVNLSVFSSLSLVVENGNGVAGVPVVFIICLAMFSHSGVVDFVVCLRLLF